ncbi:MAG: hypothetical protein OES23_04985 [Nitrosopumilus sp.]|nr:hypothetical protein [Nitrosopumilus sp.]
MIYYLQSLFYDYMKSFEAVKRGYEIKEHLTNVIMEPWHIRS